MVESLANVRISIQSYITKENILIFFCIAKINKSVKLLCNFKYIFLCNLRTLVQRSFTWRCFVKHFICLRSSLSHVRSVQNDNRFNSFLRLIRIQLKLHDLYDIDNFWKYLINNNQLNIPFQNETDWTGTLLLQFNDISKGKRSLSFM